MRHRRKLLSVSHYFTADPDPGPSQEVTREVTLRGRPFTVTTDRGVFSGQKLDPGTKVLLQLVPDPPSGGVALDIGCGWGPITMALADASPEARVVGVDVNPRAVALTQANLHSNGLTNGEAHLVEEFLAAEPDTTFDVMWSNPPIRVGKETLHRIMRTWLPRLAPGGYAYLVVSKNLGGDSLHRWLQRELGLEVERIGSRQGYRVLAIASHG